MWRDGTRRGRAGQAFETRVPPHAFQEELVHMVAARLGGLAEDLEGFPVLADS